MAHTTQSNNAPKSLTLDDIQKAVDAIEALPKPTEWMLASPDGRFWKGKPEELLNVLMPHHPLLKPMSLGELLKR